MNKFDEMRAAVQEAKGTFEAADSIANDMAYMLAGRMKQVSQYRLAVLKRELRDFNIHTGKWGGK